MVVLLGCASGLPMSLCWSTFEAARTCIETNNINYFKALIDKQNANNSLNTLAGYTGTQVIFFFLTFNIIDVTSQFLFREVYRFRPMIVSGDFDFVLVNTILNAL